MTNEHEKQERPTGWTPTAEPISIDKLGRQPPPWIPTRIHVSSPEFRTLFVGGRFYPRSRVTRMWVQPEGAGWIPCFETITDGAEYVTKLDVEPSRRKALAVLDLMAFSVG